MTKKMTGAEAMQLVVEYYRDEFMIISIRMQAFRFHQSALRKEVFYDRRNQLASAYRLDHNFDNLFIEAKKIGELILSLNWHAKRDPYIGCPFLPRTYKIKDVPDPREASDEEIAQYFRDVFAILDDYDDLVYEARLPKEEEASEQIAQ